MVRIGSAFGPLVLMSLYSSTVNRYGAMAGILVGTLVTMTWPTLNPLFTKFELLAMIPGFFMSAAAIYLVSFLTREKNNPRTSTNLKLSG